MTTNLFKGNKRFYTPHLTHQTNLEGLKRRSSPSKTGIPSSIPSSIDDSFDYDPIDIHTRQKIGFSGPRSLHTPDYQITQWDHEVKLGGFADELKKIFYFHRRILVHKL